MEVDKFQKQKTLELIRQRTAKIKTIRYNVHGVAQSGENIGEQSSHGKNMATSSRHGQYGLHYGTPPRGLNNVLTRREISAVTRQHVDVLPFEISRLFSLLGME